MQCSKCGTSCPEEAQFCPNCGAPTVKASQAQQGMPSVASPYGQAQRAQSQQGDPYRSTPQTQGQVNPYQAQPQFNPYQPVSQSQPQMGQGPVQTYSQPQMGQVSAPASAQPQLGMKWFQVMRVFMILGVIGAAANAVLLVTGMIWMQSGYDPSWVYGLYPAMQARDIFSGVLYLGAAVLCGMTAYCMTKYDRRTPLLATIIYGVTCAVSVVSVLLSDAVVGVFPYEDVSMAGAYVVLGIVMVLVNRSYFNKRKHLFVK